MNLKNYINEYSDFPRQGIDFKDISPIFKDPLAWKKVISYFENICNQSRPNLIAGIESRGFIIGSALATALNIGFIPIRKKGKLPGEVLSMQYSLEYGNDIIEIQDNSISNDDKVFIIDDLLATGGTAKAAFELISKKSKYVVGLGFIVELKKLKGREKIGKGVPLFSLITYE